MAITKVNNAMQDALAAAQPTITSVGTLTGLDVTGTVTANAGVVVDTITIDGSEIDASGSLTLDVAGDITLDADGGSVFFKDAGTEFFKVRNTGSDVQIYSARSDADIKIEGVDGGVGITALTLDMSAAGAATFNSSITSGGLVAVENGSTTGTYGLRHEGAGKYFQVGVPNDSFTYFQTDTNGGFNFEANIRAAGNLTVIDNLVIGTSGKGIDFSANGNAGGMTSEVLDDYEEGTFTMSINGVTGTPQVLGYYTKVGNKVYFQYYTGGSATFSAVSATFSGLPFTSSNTAQNYATFNTTHNTRTGSATSGYIALNSTTGYFLTDGTITVPSYTAGVGYFMVSGHYLTD